MTSEEWKDFQKRFVCNKKEEKTVANCLREGLNTYQRLDAGPMTQDDISFIRRLDLGQITRIKSGDVGDQLVVVYWECDSSG